MTTERHIEISFKSISTIFARTTVEERLAWFCQNANCLSWKMFGRIYDLCKYLSMPSEGYNFKKKSVTKIHCSRQKFNFSETQQVRVVHAIFERPFGACACVARPVHLPRLNSKYFNCNQDISISSELQPMNFSEIS
jgi:hypothetical protein